MYFEIHYYKLVRYLDAIYLTKKELLELKNQFIKYTNSLEDVGTFLYEKERCLLKIDSLLKSIEAREQFIEELVEEYRSIFNYISFSLDKL